LNETLLDKFHNFSNVILNLSRKAMHEHTLKTFIAIG